MKFSRRDLLRSAGVWSLLAPVLMSREVHAMPGAPKRVVIIFSPNGPCIERGPATGSERTFDLHEWWGPLERHKRRGCFFTGLHQAGVPFGEHNEWGHQSAGTGALTARTTEKTNNSTGPSLDQFIGQQLHRSGILTPKRSALWGLHNNVGHWGPWYEAAGKPISPVSNPYDALAELAPFLQSSEGRVQRTRSLARRRFILDHAYRDCAPLRAGLDGRGREILDFHCANIEALEQSVGEALDGQGAMCAIPESLGTSLGPDENFVNRSARDEAMKAFVELTALSFACDLTRVVGLSFGGTAARFSIPEAYDIPSSAKVDSGDSGPQHHAWTHVYNEEGQAERARALRGFTRWYAEWVARLLDKLVVTKDADGRSLLETTLVLWTSELGYKSDRGAHPNTQVPVMLFGDSEGAFETGRHFEMTEGNREARALPLHALFVSMIQHMGLTHIDTFGNAGSGPLEWLQG